MLSDLDSEADVESIWTEIISCLIGAFDCVCGWMTGNSTQEREKDGGGMRQWRVW